MFDIGAPELLVLIVAAVIVFGPDRLPEFFRKAARVLKYVRGIAGNAQDQLKQELGSDFDDFDFRDLNPKQFVQKHLLNDIEPIVADVKGQLSSAAEAGTAAAAAVKAGSFGSDDTKPVSAGAPAPVLVAAVPYDTDAT